LILGRDSEGNIFATPSGPALRPTQLPVQWVAGALSPLVKWLEREADHSLPFSDEVKNAWSYTSTPQYVFMARCLIKQYIRLYGMVFS